MKSTKMRPKCDLADMKKHLQRMAVRDRASGESKVTIQIFPGRKGSTVKPEVLHMTVDSDSIADLAKRSKAGATVSVVPQRADGQGRKKENILGIRYLVADLDHDISILEIRRLKVQPDIIVETSPQRYHLEVYCQQRTLFS
jgi:hypothetical protein